MKKYLVLLFCLLLWGATPVQACCEGGGERLLTGLKNFATAPLEIPQKAAYYAKETAYHPFGIAAGLGEGSMAMARKLFAGVFQILTFPFDPDVIDYSLE